MYKKQLGFQKIVCMLGVVIAALWFVYSLGMITDIYEALSPAIRDFDKPDKVRVEGAALYLQMQDFNTQFTLYSIGLILVSCLLFLTNTNVRRRYYIGNYVAVAVYCVAAAALFFWAHSYIDTYTTQFLTTVDFEGLAEYAEMWGYSYTTSTWLLDLHMVLGGLTGLTIVALIGNVIWKITLMRDEQKLIEAGKGAA